jgi:Ca-activated chloride channel family protein
MPKLADPAALWLLLAVPALLALALREQRRRRARLAQLGEVALLSRLAVGSGGPRRLLARCAAITAYALLVVALAGPKWGERTEILPRRGLDVVFALDVSASMRARDVRPDRLERAKAEVSVMLDRLGEHRVGLVAFAGSAFVQCPLTTDAEAVRAFLRGLSPDAVPQGGTELFEGMMTALNLFLAEEEADPAAKQAGRLLVVLTDGEDHGEGAAEAAQALKEAGIAVLLIGVGSQLGEPIPLADESGRVIGYKKDRKGETVMTRMSPETLTKIAGMTGGRFIDGQTRTDLGMGEVESMIGQLEKRDFESRIKRTDIDRSAWPLAGALLLLLLSTWRELSGRRRRERVTPFVAALGLTVVVFAGGARAQATAEPRWYERTEPHVEAGLRALERGEHTQAIERFREADAEHADERAVIEYDVGQALLLQGRDELQNAEPASPDEAPPGQDLLLQAGESFERAFGIARSEALRSRSALASGNAHALAGELDKAIDGYRRALVADPMNEAARQNLGRVLRAMRAQPPPPPSGGGEDDREEKEDGGEEPGGSRRGQKADRRRAQGRGRAQQGAGASPARPAAPA